ncbi:MAG: hypothetical protein J2P57_19415 [Acidimicrobiaceae bacterium]|nr:hypothetical protein [Acidimicrobiaceae bacterium]
MVLNRGKPQAMGVVGVVAASTLVGSSLSSADRGFGGLGGFSGGFGGFGH